MIWLSILALAVVGGWCVVSGVRGLVRAETAPLKDRLAVLERLETERAASEGATK